MKKKILTVLGIIVAVIVVFYFILFLTASEKSVLLNAEE